ncbi:MAG TPA: hypothetical protein VH500_23705 [Nitrososphaeraceae archaeon]
MNRTSLATVIPLILLATLATTPIMVTEDAFARYQRHTDSDLGQAVTTSTSCLNPVSNSNTNDNMISNGNCGGTVSQQGQSGQASNPTTVQDANPTIEVQRSTSQPPLTTTRGNCTACFDPLTPAQITEFETTLRHNSMAIFGKNITTIEQLCTFLENIFLQGESPIVAIETATELLKNVQGVSSTTVSNIETCLDRTFV